MSDVRRGFVLGVVVLVVCAVAALVFVRSRSDAQISDISAGQLYGDIAAALTRPGMVAIVRYERERSPTGRTSAVSTTMWLDAHNDLARIESTYDYGTFGTPTTTDILRDGYRYVASDHDVPVKSSNGGCPESELRALAALGTCYDVPHGEGEFESHVEEGREFDDRGALALVTKGSFSGIDSTITVNNVLYVDPETRLPFALRVTGKDRMLGHTTNFVDEKRYSVEFVRADSLPPNFFEAPAVDEIEADPELPLLEHPPTYPVYWLGREFARAAGLPALSLSEVYFVEQDEREEDSTVTLTYLPASDASASPYVSLSNWPRGHWDTFVSTGAPPPHRADPCLPPERSDTAAGPATFYAWPGAGPQCDQPLSFTVEVDTGATIVVITSSTYGMQHETENPYASREALGRLVAELVER
jgi:hypothetical protein